MCRCLPPSLRPSPVIRRVGVRISTFEACSSCTRVTARWLAQPPKAAPGLDPGASIPPVAQQNRSSATRAIDNSLCGTFLHWRCAPSGRTGYRYQPTHPETGRPWPPMPDRLIDAWRLLAPDAPPPEACLINFYEADARMGLHQDRDEQELSSPVLIAVAWRFGALPPGRVEAKRSDPFVLAQIRRRADVRRAGAARLSRRRPDRAGSAPLLPNGGRINLTLRWVTRNPGSSETGAIVGSAPA